VRIEVLARRTSGALVYVYRPRLLTRAIQQEQVAAFLTAEGYDPSSLSACIEKLHKRICGTDLQSQMSETTAANARAAVWAAFVRQNPDRLTAVPDAWRKYSARTLTDFTATDLLRAGETLAYLQKQTALTVDYVTVAVVDAPGGEALTEDGLQVVESLLQ